MPDLTCWILGTIASQMQRRFEDLFEFRTVSAKYLDEHPRVIAESVDWADVVHCLDVHVPRATYREFLRKALVATVHHMETTPPLDHALSHIRSEGRPDALVAVCNEVAESLKALGADDGIVSVVPNGVDTSVFRCPSPRERAAARRRLRIRKGQFALGFFTKINPIDRRKGADILLEALTLLRARDVLLLSTGPKPLQFTEALNRIGVPHRSDSFVLQQSHMVPYYWALDAYLITSRNEGGPVTLLEAMACGVPVVTTPVGMALDYAIGGKNALVVPKDDAGAVATAVLNLMDSPERAASLSKAGRETALAKLQWDAVLCGLPAVYEKALARFRIRCRPGAQSYEREWAGPSVDEVKAFDLSVLCHLAVRLGQVKAARGLALSALRRSPRAYLSRHMLREAFQANPFFRAAFAARDWFRRGS